MHEQRILNRLMKSWVQAVCENQPLGVVPAGGWGGGGPRRQSGLTGNPLSLADEICDYFGVKIAMYFAWLGFYTSAMVYPAVFGSVLYTFTEADQVPGVDCTGAGRQLAGTDTHRPPLMHTQHRHSHAYTRTHITRILSTRAHAIYTHTHRTETHTRTHSPSFSVYNTQPTVSFVPSQIGRAHV